MGLWEGRWVLPAIGRDFPSVRPSFLKAKRDCVDENIGDS